MGMYTQLDAQLKLKNCEETGELLLWALSDYDNIIINKLSSFAFFEEERRYWFHFNIIDKTKEYTEVTIHADLKNYEQEIQKLLDILKPLIIDGYYKSLYESHELWFDHLTGKYEKEDCCPYCGCSEDECKDAGCQY